MRECFAPFDSVFETELQVSVIFIFSKKFAMITVFASLGQNFINSTFNTNTNFSLGSTSTLNFDSPLEINMPKNSEIQASAGIRLQFAIFTLYANQTFSSYPSTSLVIGISFR